MDNHAIKYFNRLTAQLIIHPWAEPTGRKTRAHSSRFIIIYKKRTPCVSWWHITAQGRRLLRVQDPPHTPKIFLLQIYMNHTNDLFWIQNGKFRRKVTSLHPWQYTTVVFCRVFTPGVTEVWFKSWLYFTSLIQICKRYLWVICRHFLIAGSWFLHINFLISQNNKH